jgi:hypothetical protein
MIKIRSILTAAIILTVTPLYVTCKGKSSKKVSKSEYAKLITECRAIRDRIIRENSFESVKQQVIQSHAQVTASITERFVGMGSGSGACRSSAFQAAVGSGEQQLAQNLSVMEAQHNIRVAALIAVAIEAYLRNIGIPTAMKLLADLMAGNQTL